VYDQTKSKPRKPELDYFGGKAGTSEVSTLSGLVAAPIPLLVVRAELDPEPFTNPDQAQLLSDALCVRGRCPRLVVLKGHSHMSEVYAINTPDRSLAGPMIEFVKSGR
jgi:triacylglycerol lipase